VSAADVSTYRRVVTLIDWHAGGGDLVAGPDCPEMYFLTGRVNRSGTLLRFSFRRAAPRWTGRSDSDAWAGTNVVVLNHQADFSPPPSSARVAEIRKVFKTGELVGKFEVRWR
jgi:hypothetical protein